MHNLKEIRKNLEIFKKKFDERNIKINFEELLAFDKENRDKIQKKESLEQEKKILSKSKEEINFKKSKNLSKEIESLSTEQSKLQIKINLILSKLPNISLDDVPIGNDETGNVLIKKVGGIKKFEFKIKSHIELGENKDLIDFKTATKLSGSRFVVLKDKFALLERALINLMLDIHVNKFGYIEISPPLIVNEEVMFGTGQLPKFEEDQFEVKTEKNE